MSDEGRDTNQSGPRRRAVARAQIHRPQAAAALRQAVWIDVIERISALLAEDRTLTSVLGDAARCILDGFGLRAVAIGVVDGPWIEYRGVATERYSIAHRVQLQPAQQALSGSPFPTEIVESTEPEAGDDGPQGLTPLIRLPIWSRQRVVAALIVEIDQSNDLDVDDVEALSRIAQIIGHVLARGNGQERPSSGEPAPKPRAEDVELIDPSDLTAERLGGWAQALGAVALRVVVDDWSGAWTVAGLADGAPAPGFSLVRLLAVPEVRAARETLEIQILDGLWESPAYIPASPIADSVTVVPVVVCDAPAGAVIAEVAAGTAVDVEGLTRLAESVAGLVDLQRQRFNHLRAEQFVEVLDRVGHMSAGDDTLDEALDALGSVLHGVLGFDVGYGVIRGDRLHVLSLHRDGPAPAWFREGIPLELGITGRVALTGQEAFVPDITGSTEYLDLGDGALSELCVPVYQEGELVGVFNVESTARRLDDLDAQLLRTAFGMVHVDSKRHNPADSDNEMAPDTAAAPPGEVPRRGGIDPLTGVPDQNFLYDRLAVALEEVRESAVPVSILAIDVAVRAAGADERDLRAAVMREASQRLIGQLRGEDLVAVLGEQRFGVLLAGVSAGVSLRVGNRLRRAIEGRPVRLPNGASVHLACSVGIGTSVVGSESPELLVGNAVQAVEHVIKDSRQAVGHYREIEFSTGGDGLSE